MPVEIDDLIPEAYYWARHNNEDSPEIVQISTIFGSKAEFLTVARMGTDEHIDLKEFVFIEIVRTGTRDLTSLTA